MILLLFIENVTCKHILYQDDVIFEDNFLLYWGQEISMRCNKLMDRNGNIVTIRVHDDNVGGKSFSSRKEIATIYNLTSDHFIVTQYTGNTLFEFRIFNMIWEEIQYPVGKDINSVLSTSFSTNFFTCFRSVLKLKKVKIDEYALYSYFNCYINDLINIDQLFTRLHCSQ